MKRLWRIRRPSPSMAVAMIALFVALGPAAYAANTIFSEDIVDGEVKKADIATNAVGSTKVIDNSIKGIDVDESTLNRVPNADKLDGRNSTGFIQGKGNIYRDSFTVPTNDTAYQFLAVPGFGALIVSCLSDGTAGQTFLNQSGGNLHAMWFSKDGAVSQTVVNDARIVLTPDSSAPYVVVLQVSRAGRTATFTSSQEVTPAACSFGGQAVAQIDS